MTRQFALKAFVALSLLVWCADYSTGHLNSSPALNASQQFAQVVDEYFDAYFQFHPQEGTAAGFHQYDTKLEDYASSAREAEAAKLKEFQSRFAALDARQLPPSDADDLEWLQDSIKARLLELETIRMWTKDPDQYPSGVGESIFLLIKRDFAPPEERLKSVISRERGIPTALMAGRRNLQNPPRIYTQICLEQLPGTIDFFQKDVPQAFTGVADKPLLEQFRKTNTDVLSALRKYQVFVQDDLLPVSKGDFRIGAEDFREKLLYEEMVDIPLEGLKEIGYADLRRNQQKLKETAALIDPHKSPREVLAELEKDHPAPGQLLASFRDTLESLRRFIREKQIMTIPAETLPKVLETPPFMRATTTASLDAPGAFETHSTESMFNVTLPSQGWKPRQVEEWMEGFNRGTILSTSIHEVFPGHYMQYLWQQRFPSKVRKLVYAGTNVEGWAHYTEQMMLDEGFGGGDPRLRMGQLQDALLRDARFIVGIELHTGNLTLDQAKEFFVHEGYQVPPVAEVEMKRGTSDPTYLVYTLGKLQILKLREDYKKMRGAQFTLRDFHDRFMEQGGVPIRIVRKTMLGNDTPTL